MGQILQQDNRSSSARQIPQNCPLFSGRTVARIAPSETRGKNWIQRQFRGEIKPSKHRFSPPKDQTYLYTRETKFEVSKCHTKIRVVQRTDIRFGLLEESGIKTSDLLVSIAQRYA